MPEKIGGEEEFGDYATYIGLIKQGQLDHARSIYDKSRRDERPEPLWSFSLPAGPLFRAYAMDGKPGKAFNLFQEEMKNLAKKCQDREVQQACLALSKSNDVWTVLEEWGKIAEEDRNKDFQRWFLEAMGLFCFAAISSDYSRRLYRRSYKGVKVRERNENKKPEQQRRRDLLTEYPKLLKAEQAFQLLRKAYRKQAEICDDKELQQACLAFSESNDIWTLYEEAKKLTKKYRNEELLSLLLRAIAWFSAESILYYSKTGNIEKAQILYDDLKQMVQKQGEKQPNEQRELARLQAKGAVNLVYAYVTAEKPDEARAVYRDLRKLAEDYSERPKLRVWQANRASDVIYAYATTKKPDEARAVYEELRKLAEDRPEEPKLGAWQAEGAVDLVYAYCKAGKYVEAKKIFQELEELRSDGNVGLEVGKKKKINGVPVMDWLRQLLQKDSGS